MDTPRLEIDLDKIRHNTRTIVQLCRKQGIEVVGVTKGVSGMPQVARAMLEEGVCCLAEARMRNIQKLRKAGIAAPIMMLRLPKITSASSIVKHTEISINSEWRMIRSLSRESRRTGRPHKIILMVDVGDLREGVMYTRVAGMMERIFTLEGIVFQGIGTNVGCYGGVLPTERNMGILAEIAHGLEERFAIKVPTVSVGGTNCLTLVKSGKMPRKVNQIRVGEGILLGRDSSRNTVLENTFQDAFRLAAEIVEIKYKPSLPIGLVGRDAFGNTPKFKNRGVRRKALIALGKQDVLLSGLIPEDKNIKILGGSSDYIVLDISDSERNYSLGDEIYFRLLYPGLLSITTSPYVHHHFKEGATWKKEGTTWK